jgi:hypothetical protein
MSSNESVGNRQMRFQVIRHHGQNSPFPLPGEESLSLGVCPERSEGMARSRRFHQPARAADGTWAGAILLDHVLPSLSRLRM